MLDKKTTVNLFMFRILVLFIAILCMGMFISCSSEVNGPDFNFPENGFDNFTWDVSARKYFSNQYTVQNRTRINVEAINGEVMVTGQTGINHVSVTADLFAGADTLKDAEIELENLEVQVNERLDEIFIRTVHLDNTGSRSFRVEYDIIVPDNFEVEVSQDNGRIEISDIQNNVEVLNGNGDVLLTGINGSVGADVDSGSIEGAVVLPLNQAIDWSIGNGSLELSLPASTSADLSAFIGRNGEIKVFNLDIMESSNTPKTLRGSLGAGEGSITLSTHNGNIEIIGYN